MGVAKGEVIMNSMFHIKIEHMHCIQRRPYADVHTSTNYIYTKTHIYLYIYMYTYVKIKILTYPKVQRGVYMSMRTCCPKAPCKKKTQRWMRRTATVRARWALRPSTAACPRRSAWSTMAPGPPLSQGPVLGNRSRGHEYQINSYLCL